jgi:Ribonuclease G/E
MRRVVIDGQPGEIRAAVLADEHLIDLLIDCAEMPNPVGARYLGRVTSFDHGMQAAFVDLGLEQPALLPRKRAMTRLNEGDRTVVEVIRAPAPDKGAKVKQAIPDADETKGRVPRLLVPAAPLADLLNRYAPADIRVAGEAAMRALRTQAPNFAATATAERVDSDLFAALDLDGTVDSLLNPRVPLSDGGRLWIEPVRALTAIDLDTGEQVQHTGASGRAPAAANRAAIPEIARQIRLRGLSGLIVVDLLDVETKAVRNDISAELQAAFADDTVPTDVGPMRASGLVEITRQRTRLPLHELLMERCGRDGGGFQLRAETVARHVLRGVETAARAQPARRLRVHAAPEVAAALDNAVPEARAAATHRLGEAFDVVPDPALGREAWHVEGVERTP